jgi:PAS domain S-box-containing protein
MTPEALRQALADALARQAELERLNEVLQQRSRDQETITSLFNHAVLGMYRTSMDGRPILGNQALSTLLGFASFEDLVAQDRAAQYDGIEVNATYSRTRFRQEVEASHGQVVGLESQWTRPDGEVITLRESAWAVLDAQGRVEGYEGILEDITEVRRLEEALRASEAQNQRLAKAESLARMAASIAHHFNNKLQSVMTNLELVEDPPGGADPAAFLALAKKATDEAAVVSRLMQVYLGHSTGTQEPVRLADLCRESKAQVRATLAGGVTLTVEGAAPGPAIRANAEQFHQLLACLLTNAAEAQGEGGGSIRMTLRPCSSGDIPEAHRWPAGSQPGPGDHVCLEVADEGCGIPEGELDQLFDPFFSTKGVGRGLGLSVVLGIAQAHGGLVCVESRPGHGSAFRLYFPVTSEAVPERAQAGAGSPAAAGFGTVLLVDDDELVLLATGTLVKRMGFSLLEARDGVEALELFREHRQTIRCVITDLTMPRMDGWETLTALRRLEPDLPVIMASGYDKAYALSGQHPDRPQAFLGKPFTGTQLRETMGQVLGEAEK